MADWYEAVDGQSQGPYVKEQLQAWLRGGELAPDAQVWDGDKWGAAAELLAGGESAPAAPAAMPAAQPDRASQPVQAEPHREIKLAPAVAAPPRQGWKIAVVIVGGLLFCLSGYLAIRASKGAGSLVEAKQQQMRLMTVLAQEFYGPDGNIYFPPPAATPQPLTAQLAQFMASGGYEDKPDRPLSYVGDRQGYRVILPLKNGAGWLAGDPLTQRVSYLAPDSGPVSWNAVRNLPEMMAGQ